MAKKPQMVSLEDFGKPPPPPAKAPFPVVAYSTFTALIIFIVVGGWFAYDWMDKRAMQYWGKSAEIADAGRFGTK
ncbi:MAG: hypothetical protein ACKO2D_11185 [Chloroflexota bacterium]